MQFTELQREFLFTDSDFRYIQKIVSENTGIVLSDIKRAMVYGRIVRRVRALGLKTFAEYCEVLKSGDHAELNEFTNAITTNLTSFFRENHHFEYLADTILPELEHKHRKRRIRIWSAGCSSGEEPYSIAMTVMNYFPAASGWDIKILATDLDANMVAHASQGVYLNENLTGISQANLHRYALKGKGQFAGKIKIIDELKQLITFKQLNLLHDWPFKGQFDIVFCRNVIIYFSKDTQRVLFDRYAEAMPDNATLFIGHSESLFQVTDRFKSQGKTIYRKVK